jgi:hypothetical protein
MGAAINGELNDTESMVILIASWRSGGLVLVSFLD